MHLIYLIHIQDAVFFTSDLMHEELPSLHVFVIRSHSYSSESLSLK